MRLENRLERLCMERADAAYAPSAFAARFFAQKYGIKMGVVRPPFLVEEQPADVLPFRLPSRYLIHFGTLGPVKGTDIVARAIVEVWKEQPDFCMVFAGKESRRGLFERYACMWGAESKQVIWLGSLNKPHLYAVLKGAEASVLPSRCDNLPNTVIESLSFGIPVIGSYGCSIEELIEPGKCGDLIAAEDHVALARLMLSVWRHEASWANGAFCRPRILDEMEPRRAVQSFLAMAGFST